ncbi:hypothetical protein BLA29_007073 [Euroglyphus maynei]|uniref:Hydroxysteroid dehydrogenase-like protein n=1 Tax=Euroglyphus maynei TaxID=6958 RepID=A0A1Y3AXI4_EURMA|nr:hypothetical protein BLA29_007073 [Euroglyphus maynei]
MDNHHHQQQQSLIKELPFPVPRKRNKLYVYYSTMGYLFQIVRDIDPKLRLMIDTFTLIGFIYSARFLWTITSSVFNGFYVHVWSRIWFRQDLAKKYGKWAIITGATDGIGLEYARQFAERGINIILLGHQPETKLWEHVRVNMLAVIMMTRLVLPSMVKRKKGLVINVASIAGYQPLPLMGVYSASKVNHDFFFKSKQYQ